MKKLYLLSTIILLLCGTGYAKSQWIEPSEYQQMLGSGMDVDWWTAGNNRSGQNWGTVISDFGQAGVQHVRITLTQNYLSPQDFLLLDEQVNQCINNGISPIIAYKPSFARRYGMNYEAQICNWWRVMAEHYRGYPARLSFDILLEPNSSMFASYSDLNDFYEDCVADIRNTNPYRIIFIAPTYNSDPLYLKYLRIPSRANGYLMAEWHFLSERNYNRAWNNWRNRRSYEEDWINGRINAALAWQRRTGIYTYVGGWAPGTYFSAGYSSAQEAYTSFFCNALLRACIPYAVRGHYYDYGNRQWHSAAYRPMRTIFPRNNFAHSGMMTAPPRHNYGFSIGGRPFGNNMEDNRNDGYRQNFNNGNRGNGFNMDGNRNASYRQDFNNGNRNNGFSIGGNRNDGYRQDFNNGNRNDNSGYSNNRNNGNGSFGRNSSYGNVRSGGNGRSNNESKRGNSNVPSNNENNNSGNRSSANNYRTGNSQQTRQDEEGFSRSGRRQQGQQAKQQQSQQTNRQSSPTVKQTGENNSSKGNATSRQSSPTVTKKNTPANQQQPTKRKGGRGFSRGGVQTTVI